jgi:predicted ribosome-associated RNA-binding protein Tma20
VKIDLIVFLHKNYKIYFLEFSMESSNLEAQYKGESVKDWVHHLQDVIGNQTRSILESTFREVQ